MATELQSHAKDVNLTRFFGGKDRGVCVQLTTGWQEHLSLTRAQAAAVAADLMDFAQGRETQDDV